MRNWNRREFTRNAGMLALFSPFIGLLEPKLARAQAAPGKAKYLLIMGSNGTEPGEWQPGGSPSNVEFTTKTATLAPVKNDVILLNKFNSNGSAGSHAAIGALTGNGAYKNDLLSLDEWVAADLRKRGILTQVPSIHLGGMLNQEGMRFINNKVQIPTFSLAQAFSNIFDGAAPPAAAPPATGGTPAPTGPSAEEIRLRRRQSILDVVRFDLTQLERSLGGIEKQKLQVHADSIRQLEERIAQQLSIQQGTAGEGTVGNGSSSPAPTFISPVACQRPGNMPANLRPIENSAVHLSMAVTAFACDITRVALVEFGHHQSTPIELGPPGDKSLNGDWHNDFMHSQQAPHPGMTNLERWLGDRVVEMIAQLKATPAPDGQGTLFDQTYFLWSREMGDAVNHAGDNMPYVISGRAGGYLRPGNGYISGNGLSHIGILASAAEAMGATDVSTIGGAGDVMDNSGKVVPRSQRVPFPGLRT